MPKGSPGRVITFEGGGASGGSHADRSRELLLPSLEAITRIAAEAQSLADGLARALDILCDTLHWPIGHVYQRAGDTSPTLVSAEVWHLEPSSQFAAFQEQTIQTTFRPGQGLVGQVLAQQRPGLSPDVSRDRRFLRRRTAQAEGVHAWLAFPVIADGQVIAVCELFTTERVTLDVSLAGLLSCVGLSLGRLYERERWRAECEALRRQIAAGAMAAPAQDRGSLSSLAAAIAHEVNSPLFSARASLALLSGSPEEQALIAAARADLARIAAVMETLQSLAQTAPLGQRLDRFTEPPVA